MKIQGKYGEAIIYAQTIDETTIDQITKLTNSPLAENANIRIMPDCHAGAGCVIGTTMLIKDKVCPNLVGVDIGCGVMVSKLGARLDDILDLLDKVIRENIPFGTNSHAETKYYDFERLRCWDKLPERAKELSQHSLGTLGGGNHFIEAYNGGLIAVHSGSRNIGLTVAQYYQSLAEQRMNERIEQSRQKLAEIEPTQRQKWIDENKIIYDKELAYLEGEDMDDYLHDIKILQDFAHDNRLEITRTIFNKLNCGDGKVVCDTIHNYIDTDLMILRKGSVSAKKDELLAIPLNMRDGLMLCEGKGNHEWNYSAPHGAGRVHSRTEAKKLFTVNEYAKTMEDIYSTCINENTLDEAPFAYKDADEIKNLVKDTVDILEVVKPIYNFKAN